MKSQDLWEQLNCAVVITPRRNATTAKIMLMENWRTKVDDVDVMILRELQAEGRISNVELARRVQLSPPSVLQRVRRLEETGLIRDYVTRLNGDVVGLKLTVFVHVSLSLAADKPIETFRKAVKDIPNVLECYQVSGEYDFLLKVVAADMAGYEKLVREQLTAIKGIGKIYSSFVIQTSKDSTVLPL